MSKTWTEERTELLKELWKRGLSAGQIAIKLKGPSRNAVIGKIHRMGLGGYEPAIKKFTPRRPKKRNETRHQNCKSLEAYNKKIKAELHNRPPQDLPRDIITFSEAKPEKTIQFKELKDGLCKHPYGFRNYEFCGAKTKGGSYCEYHKARNFKEAGDR